MSTTPTIRPVRKTDLAVFYPDGIPGSTRGWAFEVDGEVACVGGVMYTHPVQCYSHVLPPAKKYPKLIYTIAKRLMKVMDTMECPVYALASTDHPDTAPRLLDRMGFVMQHETPHGDLYSWRGR